MTTLLSNFVEKVQNKHWQNLRRKTQKLEHTEKENLLVLLEDNLAGPEPNERKEDSDDDEYVEEDYELLQRDIDKANVKLEKLQSKHDFLKTRLETYRTKIQQAEDNLENMEESRRDSMKAKIDTYKQSLQPVEETFRSLTTELTAHQQKIDSMQDRQLELKLKTQECKVVLDELCYGMETHARLPYEGQDEEILANIDGKGDATSIDNATSFRDEDESKSDGDVENAGTEEKKVDTP